MLDTNFTTLDWVIVVLYLLVSLGIGIAVRKSVRGMSDFVCAGRGLGTALGVATLTGTELGLITVMYSAEKGFNEGFAAFHIALIAGIVTFVVGATGFFVYRLRAMQVMTIPEFYERRFGRRTRILGGIVLSLGGILNMGLFLKIGSMFVVGVTGMSESSQALPVVMILLICLVLLYTVLGGMISVVITDYVQFVVLSFGFLVATWLAVNHLGWDEIWETVRAEKGLKGFDPTHPESGFGWEYILWQVFIGGLVGCAIWPTAVARALAADSPRTVKRQFMWGSVSFLIRFLIPYFWGICAFVFIVKGGGELHARFFAPEAGTEAMQSLYGMPIFLGKVLPAGLLGLVTAGMLAAFMSTHDSYLLCWSSVLTQDVVAPLTGEKMSERKRIRLTRILIVALGGYVLYWGLFYEGNEDIWDYMGVTGTIYAAGAFALLLFGLYWKRASSTGAVLALLAGLAAIFGLKNVQAALHLTDLPVELSPARVCLFTLVLVVVAMVMGSLLWPDRDETERSPEEAR